MAYEAVIGLEVHSQLKTESKLFCSCSTEFGAEPNTNICPICTGQPGVLPVQNKKAVELVIMTGLALGSRISSYSRFSRKQYFYPDLPKNYQISQFETPLCINGSVPIVGEDGSHTSVGLIRIHLEEDAGKLLHQIGSRSIDGSLIDFNRTGVPLMEIVSQPAMHTPDEAYAYLVSLKEILEYIGVSDCNMEEGKLRCDANISIRLKGETTLGTKIELKNMNSFKHIRTGIAYEIQRQIDVVSSGGRLIQETRLWDEEHGTSHSMRTKEESHDYRYFPEPDLAPMVISPAWIEDITARLSELPAVRRKRFIDTYGLSSYDAQVLGAEKALADYYEAACGYAGKTSDVAKIVANWISTELLGRLNAQDLAVTSSPIPPEHLGALVRLIKDGTISGKIGKTVFNDMFERGKDPATIVKEKNLIQLTDEKELGRIIDEIIDANPKAVQEYKNGKERALGSLVGQVMKKTGGKANPPLVNSILKEKLH